MNEQKKAPAATEAKHGDVEKNQRLNFNLCSRFEQPHSSINRGEKIADNPTIIAEQNAQYPRIDPPKEIKVILSGGDV